jgi:hypothetical protein
MKIIIEGKITEKDLVLFAKMLREMWRHREDKLMVFIEHGMEHMTSEECMALFRQVFDKDKDWKSKEMDEKMGKEFRDFEERVR